VVQRLGLVVCRGRGSAKSTPQSWTESLAASVDRGGAGWWRRGGTGTRRSNRRTGSCSGQNGNEKGMEAIPSLQLGRDLNHGME
jgi:hypothetical protein